MSWWLTWRMMCRSEGRYVLGLEEFRTFVLEPAVRAFEDQPDCLGRAIVAVWAVDAFASHKAHANHALDPDPLRNQTQVEGVFKDGLCSRSNIETGNWQFKVVRGFSNATKHGTRKASTLVTDSGKASKFNMIGGAWFFAQSRHWGEQIVVQLNVVWDQSAKNWADLDGNNLPGLLFQMVPVMDVIGPSIAAIDAVEP